MPEPRSTVQQERRMLAKYALLINSMLVLVLGCVMVAMSMVTRLQREEISLFDAIDMDPVYIVLGVGVLVVFISLIGCLGALRESIWTLHLFCACVMIIFLLEMVTAVFAVTLMTNIRVHLTHTIGKAIKQYGTKPSKNAILDDLQQKYACCGSNSATDWGMNPFFNCSTYGRLRCSVPVSCCHHPVSTHCGLHGRQIIYGIHAQSSPIFQKGCVTVLLNIFKMNTIIIGLSMMVIGILEVPVVLEICFVPKMDHISQYPGIYLFYCRDRLIRPVFSLSQQKVELIGTFEQVYMDIAISMEKMYKGIPSSLT